MTRNVMILASARLMVKLLRLPGSGGDVVRAGRECGKIDRILGRTEIVPDRVGEIEQRPGDQVGRARITGRDWRKLWPLAGCAGGRLKALGRDANRQSTGHSPRNGELLRS